MTSKWAPSIMSWVCSPIGILTFTEWRLSGPQALCLGFVHQLAKWLYVWMNNLTVEWAKALCLGFILYTTQLQKTNWMTSKWTLSIMSWVCSPIGIFNLTVWRLSGPWALCLGFVHQLANRLKTEWRLSGPQALCLGFVHQLAYWLLRNDV